MKSMTVREITATFSTETKYYKTVASLQKHCPIGRYAHHTIHGACKVIGHVDKGRRGAKVEIAARNANGLVNLLVDSSEISMVTRIPRHLRKDVENYFETETAETKTEEVAEVATSKKETSQMGKLDTLKATGFTHEECGTIYQNSYGSYWVLDGDNVCPLEWGPPYNNVKASHISEASVDTFLKRPQSQFSIGVS